MQLSTFTILKALLRCPKCYYVLSFIKCQARLAQRIVNSSIFKKVSCLGKTHQMNEYMRNIFDTILYIIFILCMKVLSACHCLVKCDL